MTNSRNHLQSGIISTRLATKFAAWNFLGSVLPMGVALIAIPLLLQHLGKVRFGLLSMIWMLVGYFGILDLGLGRALTKMTAEFLGQGRSADLSRLFWTSILLAMGFGAVGAALVTGIAPWLVHNALTVQPEFQEEALNAFRIVSLGLPIVVLTVGLVGVLEAYHRFGIVNLVRVPMGCFVFLGPLCVLPFSHRLEPVITVLILGRVVECLVYFVACLRVQRFGARWFAFDRSLIPRLLSFGGWMTVSNLLLPLMIHMDRYLVGIWASVSVVAFYVIPSEMVVKLLILPRAWVSVLFPSFAAHYDQRPGEISALFARGVKFLLLGMFPIILVLVVFAHELLGLWLGDEMARHGTLILQLLSVGMYIYSLVYMPYLFFQGIGRPRIPAIIHFCEFPVYLGTAFLLIRNFGIAGAAWAWIVRVVLDYLLMYACSLKYLQHGKQVFRSTTLGLIFLIALTGGMALLVGWRWKVATSIVVLVTYSALVWRKLLTAEDRFSILRLIPHG